MTDLNDILGKANELRQDLPRVKTFVTSEEIKEEISKRKRFANTAKDRRSILRKMVKAYEQDMRDRSRKFKEEQDATTRLIDDTKEEIETIASELSWLAVDLDDLQEEYWERVRGRSEIKKGQHATGPDFTH